MVHIFALVSVSCPLSQEPGRLDVDEMAVGRGRWWPGHAWWGKGSVFQASLSSGRTGAANSCLYSFITPLGKLRFR